MFVVQQKNKIVFFFKKSFVPMARHHTYCGFS